jgi:hypothetical protein
LLLEDRPSSISDAGLQEDSGVLARVRSRRKRPTTTDYDIN